MFIDTHSHIYLSNFDDDIDEVVAKSLENKIDKILLPNIDSSSINAMMNLSSKFASVCYPMIGLHPTSVKENYFEELETVKHWLQKEKFYGIGETGIDLYWDKTFLEQQIDSFSQQIELAKKYQLPLVIHVRESFNEVFSVLDQLNDDSLSGVFHCFTGNADQAQKALSYGGFKLGIGGVLTFKNSNLDEVIREIELKHILLETDSPFLAPVPHRGKRNESSYLKIIATKLAEIKKVTIDEVGKITSESATKLFKLN